MLLLVIPCDLFLKKVEQEEEKTHTVDTEERKEKERKKKEKFKVKVGKTKKFKKKNFFSRHFLFLFILTSSPSFSFLFLFSFFFHFWCKAIQDDDHRCLSRSIRNWQAPWHVSHLLLFFLPSDKGGVQSPRCHHGNLTHTHTQDSHDVITSVFLKIEQKMLKKKKKKNWGN